MRDRVLLSVGVIGAWILAAGFAVAVWSRIMGAVGRLL
jgi:hypothetical protein